jgi:hypothetical protein
MPDQPPPIEQQYEAVMMVLTRIIEVFLRDVDDNARFVLIQFDKDMPDGSKCNYASNVDREMVYALLKDQVKKYEEENRPN